MCLVRIDAVGKSPTGGAFTKRSSFLLTKERDALKATYEVRLETGEVELVEAEETRFFRHRIEFRSHQLATIFYPTQRVRCVRLIDADAEFIDGHLPRQHTA